MYMNISERLGTKAIRYFIGKDPDLLHPRFDAEFVIEAVTLVSYFDGAYRRQTHGCAMGSHKSPPYASLAIGYVEEQAYDIFCATQSVEYAEYVQKMLRRFLDDIFLLWKKSLGDPNSFFDVLNNIEPKIKFTMEQGKKIPFLDICFELDSNGLSTDIFYKETDTHNYVQFGSFHPHKTLTNIPYSLARRICVIVSDSERRNQRLEELKQFLRKKKYPDAVIESGVNRALNLNRTEIINGTSNLRTRDNQEKDIPFVFTNNCANPNVLNTVRDSLNILTPSERMTTVMKNKKIVAARRQPKNIKSLLFKPRYDTDKSVSRGSVMPCKKDLNRVRVRGRPCKCCDLLQECESFTFEGAPQPFEIRHHFTCDTRNVIYALTCAGCGANYIGKTEREVRERCGEYRLAIGNKKFTQGVHRHIAECGNGNFVMTPFFKLHDNSNDSQLILSYESLFIKRYQPKLNVLKL